MELRDAERLARSMMDDHGLHTWRFAWDDATMRFGCCHHTYRKITLSRTLVPLNTPERVEQTILHEIAHALAGHDAGHGPEWQRLAKSLGHSGERCHNASNTTLAPYVWEGVCAYCGPVSKKKSGQTRNGLACKKCCDTKNGGKYDVSYKLTWREIR